ncbi:MAG: hypothetical protein AAFR38_04940 [Planctomycetota bacterium]
MGFAERVISVWLVAAMLLSPFAILRSGEPVCSMDVVEMACGSGSALTSHTVAAVGCGGCPMSTEPVAPVPLDDVENEVERGPIAPGHCPSDDGCPSDGPCCCVFWPRLATALTVPSMLLESPTPAVGFELVMESCRSVALDTPAPPPKLV